VSTDAVSPLKPDDRRYRRAPALLVEWRGSRTVVIDCSSMRRIAIDPDLVRVLAHFDAWTSLDDMHAAGVDVDGAVLERLVALRLVECAAPEHEDSDPRTVWNPFDLAVQRNNGRGGLRDHALTSDPPPLRARRSEWPTPLPPPDDELPGLLSEALRRRRSVRRYGWRALRLDELSTLLHHAGRVISARPTADAPTEALRPFAGAGARSELEIYVLAENVDSLPPGAYRYDAFGHGLELVRVRDAHQERILRGVCAAAGGLDRTPPVTLLITAVFGRIMQRYELVGLGLIYKDCGCLLQTLYLVATAMGLAPCAIGTGEELENSRWLGLDPVVEAQVGCFLVGPAVER